ncbi:MAG: hypothetical protein QXF82_07975 [Nitrososphaeria archaeon]
MQKIDGRIDDEKYPLFVPKHVRNKKYDLEKVVEDVALPYFVQKKIDEKFLNSIKEKKRS